jgi:hypothetical protein
LDPLPSGGSKHGFLASLQIHPVSWKSQKKIETRGSAIFWHQEVSREYVFCDILLIFLVQHCHEEQSN